MANVHSLCNALVTFDGLNMKCRNDFAHCSKHFGHLQVTTESPQVALLTSVWNSSSCALIIMSTVVPKDLFIRGGAVIILDNGRMNLLPFLPEATSIAAFPLASPITRVYTSGVMYFMVSSKAYASVSKAMAWQYIQCQHMPAFIGGVYGVALGFCHYNLAKIKQSRSASGQFGRQNGCCIAL